jgi:hypothetical protein
LDCGLSTGVFWVKKPMSFASCAATVIQSLSRWFAHHNELHPHRDLAYKSPRELHRKVNHEERGARVRLGYYNSKAGTSQDERGHGRVENSRPGPFRE